MKTYPLKIYSHNKQDKKSKNTNWHWNSLIKIRRKCTSSLDTYLHSKLEVISQEWDWNGILCYHKKERPIGLENQVVYSYTIQSVHYFGFIFLVFFMLLCNGDTIVIKLLHETGEKMALSLMLLWPNNFLLLTRHFCFLFI